MIKFSERLKELRTERGLLQSQLGEIMGVRQVTVCTWENGTRQPDFETLKKIAKYFDVSTDYLLGLED